MQREVSGDDKITWTCAQAYSGLSDNQENKEAARVEGSGARVRAPASDYNFSK